MISSRILATGLLALLAACAGPAPNSEGSARRARVESLLGALAADSMEGRRMSTPGSYRASRLLVAELERIGVEPAGTDGFFQEVILVRPDDGGVQLGLLPAGTDPESILDERIVRDRNVIGIVRGSDPELRDEIVVVGAHFDHLGIGPAVAGDSIYNGADDDASGTVAVVEIGRDLVRDPPPRSVLLLLSTAEEGGLLGSRLFVEEPTVELTQIVANLQIEMIGRPDSLAGGFGRAWLTGYYRSTMGDLLNESGSAIVPDPRSAQNFFARGDNIVFARAGIPAHTISSYSLHADYHQPSDEVDRVDFAHMTAVIDAIIDMVRALASGPRPEWHEGGRPETESAPVGQSRPGR